MPNWVVVNVRMLIKPNDVLLFRESKNFTAGEAHVARSQLPLPQTIAGAIRSKILVNSEFSGEALKLAGLERRDNGRYKSVDPEFEIIGQFFCKRKSNKVREYFKAPMDIVKSKGVDGCFYVRPINVLSNYVFGGRDIHFESVNGYIEGNNLAVIFQSHFGLISTESLQKTSMQHEKIYDQHEKPEKYYAILIMDGDNMGKMLVGDEMKLL